MAQDPNLYWNPNLAIWPDLMNGRVPLAPVRVGMDRRTGKIKIGWDHVSQSIETIFVTRYHERVLRRWVGSFVPHILGQSALPRVVTRFFWAIASSLDMWEPCYSIRQVSLAPWSSAEELRVGGMTFRNIGDYRPRGHLGDFTVDNALQITQFASSGVETWNVSIDRVF